MAEAWFKPKTYGYGATPTNWKGWAATVAFGVAQCLLVWIFLANPAITHTAEPLGNLPLFLLMTGALTGGFIVLCRAKTDGDWKWRWGGRE